MRRTLAAFLVVVSLAMGCASDDNTGSSGSTDDASPSSSEFVSERHSYHFDLPSGWRVNEFEGTWTDFAQFRPGG